MRRFAAPVLACALISCSRPKPEPIAAEPSALASSPSPSTSSVATRPDADTPATSAPARDALAAFVATQKVLAPERYGADSIKVTPLARDTLPALKRTSLEAVRQVLGAALAGAPRSGEALSKQVIEAFRRAGAAMDVSGVSAHEQEVGTLKEIEIQRPDGHPTKLGVVITLSLPCDSDSSFYLLEEQQGGAPAVILVDEANGYLDISEGRIALGYQVSLPDDHGGWFVVVSDAAPWCSSAWRGIRTRLLEPGPSAGAPRRVWAEHSSAYLEHEPVAAISAGRDDFELRYVDHAPPFSEGDMRDHVHHYLRRGAGVVRAQPIVAKPIDLPGEWIAMPWEEAQRFVAGGAAEGLRPWHRKLRLAAKGCTGAMTVEQEDEATGRTRLSFTTAGCKALPSRVLFEVEKDGDGWAMRAITGAR